MTNSTEELIARTIESKGITEERSETGENVILIVPPPSCPSTRIKAIK